MLVALGPAGDRIEAARNTPTGNYACPACGSGVIVKRGRVRVPHFAHEVRGACDLAVESVRHQLAKRVLADRFRMRGYLAEIEEPHPETGRRVDVAVTVGDGHRIAIEVQDSAIAVDQMKARTKADRRAGFFATVWVFTSGRAARLLAGRDGTEVRIPTEMRWVSDRYGLGVFVIDEQAGRMWRFDLGGVTRAGGSSEWYTERGELETVGYPDRHLRATKTAWRTETEFGLALCPTRYHTSQKPDWTAAFA
jgi:Competence protein CoiA-like family